MLVNGELVVDGGRIVMAVPGKVIVVAKGRTAGELNEDRPGVTKEMSRRDGIGGGTGASRQR